MRTFRGLARITAIFGLVPAALALLLPAAPATAEVAGAVSRVQAEASATTAGRTRPLARDSVINTNDAVRTGPDARLEITLRDGTKLTLGENAELIVDTFIYRPDASTRRILINVTAGAFRFVSGKVGGLGADDMTVRTQVAAIGVRGTDFWGGFIDAAFGYLLYNGGIVVSTGVGPAAVLEFDGTGVGITGAGAAPGPVVEWPEGKVARATATVAFDRTIPGRPPANRPSLPPVERLNQPRPSRENRQPRESPKH
ncbi:MAG: FecR family protein [Alphaproteobacteria bacterium]